MSSNMTGCNMIGGTSDKKRRGERGITKLTSIANMPNDVKIPIIVNEYGQSCSAKTTKSLSGWIGVTARNNRFLPMSYHDWRDLPQTLKEDAWNNIQEKFDIPITSKDFVMERLQERWRQYRHDLKVKFYSPYESDVERRENIDLSRMPEDQWLSLFRMWDDEKNQAISERNKRHKSNQTMRHTTGNVPFAVMREEMRLKDPNHLPPSRIEMFEAAYMSKKTGLFVDNVSATTMDTLKQKLAEESEERQLDKDVQNEIFHSVMGPDTHGRVRLLGSGVTPKDVYGKQGMRAQRNAQEIRDLRKENAELKEKHAELNERLSHQDDLLGEQVERISEQDHRLTQQEQLLAEYHAEVKWMKQFISQSQQSQQHK